MDPVTAIAAASSAFSLIKKGFEMGKDVESMYSDIGRWMGAVSDVNQAEKMAKNPPIFKLSLIHISETKRPERSW